MAEAPSAHAATALAVVMSLVDTLLKRGVVDHAAVDAMLKDALTYSQALCVDCSREMEREVRELLDAIGQSATKVVGADTAPIPLVDPDSAA